MLLIVRVNQVFYEHPSAAISRPFTVSQEHVILARRIPFSSSLCSRSTLSMFPLSNDRRIAWPTKVQFWAPPTASSSHTNSKCFDLLHCSPSVVVDRESRGVRLYSTAAPIRSSTWANTKNGTFFRACRLDIRFQDSILRIWIIGAEREVFFWIRLYCLQLEG